MIDIAWRYSGTDERYLGITCIQNAELPIVPKELPKAKPMIAISRAYLYAVVSLIDYSCTSATCVSKPGTKC